MISGSLIRRAKKADLPTVLQNLGIRLHREGRGFRLADHDSLKLFTYRAAWLYKWWSRNGEVGDGIQFLQRYCRMNFQQAVSELNGFGVDESGDRDYCGKVPEPESWLSPRWREKARRIVDMASANLFGGRAEHSLVYLRLQRGLAVKAIRQRRLGWLPAKGHMPSKIVIPCYNCKGRLMRIRFRMDGPKSHQERYRVMKGSDASSSFPLGLTPGKPLMWVESELDAMLIHQEAGSMIGVLATGSAASRMNSQQTLFLREKIPFNLICFDNDSCGKDATERIIGKLPNAIRWTVPEACGKDPGEAWKQLNISHWVQQGLKTGAEKTKTEFMADFR